MASECSKKSKLRKQFTREELELLDKTSLIDKVLQLEAQNVQLKALLRKGNEQKQRAGSNNKERKEFDFSRCHKRHILLKFYYLGWDYHGFVVQEDSENTIEQHLFAALKKSCCIEDRESCNYHRCGRTDKGVSAFSQVVSLDIRSRLAPEHQHKLHEELSYCKILNRLLPRDIKCIAWYPVPSTFSARFDCKSRTYKYLFPRGNLNVDKMNEAVEHIIGTHDFRNLCKMDVANGVTCFNRTVMDAKVTAYTADSTQIFELSSYDMCQLTITSQAFLWHQIRCLMGVLLLVGKEKEEPGVILQLLDVNSHPRKPQYNMAHEVPLVLYQTEYNNVEWFVDNEDLVATIRILQQDWTINSVKTSMIRSMLADLETLMSVENTSFQSDCLLLGVQSRVYQPLMKRMTCDSLEEKLTRFEKQKRKNPVLHPVFCKTLKYDHEK